MSLKLIPLKIANIINKLFGIEISSNIILLAIIVFLMIISMIVILFIYSKIFPIIALSDKPSKKKRRGR